MTTPSDNQQPLTSQPSTNEFDHIAGVGEMMAGMAYNDGPDAPPTEITLHYGSSVSANVHPFPGAFVAFLDVPEAQRLGTLLRERHLGTVNGIEVLPTPQTHVSRPDVMELRFTTGFRGMLFVLLDYAGADRLAAQLDGMITDFQQRQAAGTLLGVTQPSSTPQS